MEHGDLMSNLKFDTSGLLPVVVQSVSDGRVLMVAWANADAVGKTLELGQAVFFSRSRNEIWHKGATSGNTQRVLAIEVDCDGDTLIYKVEESGPACHNGTRSCFDTGEVALNG